MEKDTGWAPLLPGDLPALLALASLAHPSLPERAEVFAEKLSLFPQGCRKLVRGGQFAGYGVCHPWLAGAVPPLDSFLSALPAKPGCLYIHDVALAPTARGGGEAGKFVAYAVALARGLGVERLALVSVYGTAQLWVKYGFREGSLAGAKLAAYGPSARYMTLCLESPGA